MEVRELGLIGAFGVAFVLGMLVWIWWRRKTAYRRELPRIYELRDLLPNPPPPGAFLLHEVWLTREHHRLHTKTRHFLRWDARKDALLASREVSFWSQVT